MAAVAATATTTFVTVKLPFLVLVLGGFLVAVVAETNAGANETTAILKHSEVDVMDTTYFDFRQAVVDAHNRFRGRHLDTPMLFEQMDLVSSAQERCKYYAEQSKYNSDTFSFGLTHGENLWIGWSPITPTASSPIFAPADIISSWYSEHVYYSYSIPVWRAAYAHFTMMLWRSSRQLGCGRCTAVKKGEAGAKTFIVCHYRPAGNVIGQFQRNLMPLN